MTQRIVITGESNQLRHTIAAAFVTQGAQVCCIESTPDVSNHQSHRSAPDTQPAFDRIRRGFAHANAVLDGIDTLIQIALRHPIKPMPVTHAEQVYSQVALHTGSMGICCTLGIPFLQRQTGTKRIINVWLAPVRASAAVIDRTWDDATDPIPMHTLHLAEACAPHGIQVTTLITHTDRIDDVHADEPHILAWVLFFGYSARSVGKRECHPP